MSNYFDDDAFWDGPSIDPDRTSQLERIRGRSVERTRTHHVVERDDRREPLDDGSSMWIEPSPPLAGRLGPLSSVDPRVLSIGAVALAVVLAVPLFSALGNKGSGDELRAIDQQSTTTASTVATPVTTAADVVVVTAAVDADLSGDTDGRNSAAAPDQEAGEDESAGDDTAAPAAQALSASPDCSNKYTAAAGDYWLRIAEGSGASLDSLLDVNEATAETPIYPGSTVCLPDGVTAPAGFATLRDDNSTAGAATPAAARTAQAAQACGNEYASVAGDYWLRIADAAGLGLDELLALNEATPDTPLYPGSVVCLPAGASGPSAPTTAAPTTAAPTTQAPTTQAPTTHAPTTAAPATTDAPQTTAPPEADTTVPPAPPAPGEIEQIIRDVWPDDLEEQALRIAWRESGYNPRAQNFCCSGLFQIYYDVHAGWLADLGINSAEDLYDPHANATAAYALYQRSGSWEPWRMTAD
jgi:Transglycosylase SLT domain/LysM domain